GSVGTGPRATGGASDPYVSRYPLGVRNRMAAHTGKLPPGGIWSTISVAPQRRHVPRPYGGEVMDHTGHHEHGTAYVGGRQSARESERERGRGQEYRQEEYEQEYGRGVEPGRGHGHGQGADPGPGPGDGPAASW